MTDCRRAIFQAEDHLTDPKVVTAFRKMVTDTVKGAQTLTLLTLGIARLLQQEGDPQPRRLKGLKVRVLAMPTEDALFSATSI